MATNATITPKNGTLLIYAPVPLYKKDGVLMQEDQACNGLRLWAENFEKVLVMYPLEAGDPPPAWVPVEPAVGVNMARIEIHPVPSAYRPDRFLYHLGPMRRRIQALVERAQYLSFAIGGLFGDWGSVSCYEAHKAGRPFAVWTDRVESQVVRRAIATGPIRRRIGAAITHRPMAQLERYVIRRAALGLFHGRDTFDTYAPYCREPQLVHDIHIRARDHIAPDRLAEKIKATRHGPLKLAYAGRADPPKGPLDWVAVLEGLTARGVDFRATWLGDGEEHAAMRQRVNAAGLTDRVMLPGYVTDRERLLETLRDAHVFLFCHKTLESPRCLIEALISAAPIVGYHSAYAADLAHAHGGGRFVSIDNVAALTEELAKLDADRTDLANLIARAGRDGAPFTDEAVFQHRSDVIKHYL